jgi:hypothetical protein
MLMRKLPKARLISLQWSWRYFYFAKFRLANAVRFQVGWLVILVRAPWLEQSARALYWVDQS